MRVLLWLLLSSTMLCPIIGQCVMIQRDCSGDDCPISDPIKISEFFTLPIRINFDGSINFGWQTTQVVAQTTDLVIERPNGPEINWYFSPVIFVEIDKDKVLVNLSQNSLNKRINLEGANKEAGYLVLEKSGYEVGIGGGAFFDPVSAVSFGFGLLPTGGSMIYAERFAPNLEAAKNLPKMKFPTDAKSLDSWKDNDALVYTKKGGITFFTQGSSYGASVGIGYNAVGTWKVFLKKVSSGKIIGTVSKMNLNSFGVYVGATIATLNISLFKEHDKSFAYEFDLESKSGQNGFNEFLAGNFKFTKRLAQEGFVEGVTALKESNTNTTGKLLGVSVGFPFIGNLAFGKGMVQSFSEIHSLENNQKIENNMAVYSRTVETSGVASKKMKNILLFAASHQEVKGSKSSEPGDSFTTANFKWMFSQEKSQVHHIESRILDLKRITGLWNTLEFDFPQEKLTYTKFEFDAMISSKGTEKLMAMNLKRDSALIVQEKVEEFFTQENIPLRACKVFKKIENCKNHLVKTSLKALKKMAIKLEKMKKFHQEKNWKSYTETYADLGKEAITNQFTFQAFREMIGKENFKMEFKVSGEKLSELRLSHFDSDPAFQ